MTVYTDREQLELRFGAENIRQWADLDNDNDVGKIATRIDWAIAEVGGLIDDKARGGPYPVPFPAFAAGNPNGTPPKIKTWATIWAGLTLYEARGYEDSDDEAGKKFKKYYHLLKMMPDVLRKPSVYGRLDDEDIAMHAPQAVAEPCPENNDLSDITISKLESLGGFF